MSAQTLETIIFASLALLGPVLPAYLLYKKLPSRASVKGPFKGLDIQLTGAFAGYFLLFLSILSFVSLRAKPPTPYEVWQIKGYIAAEGISDQKADDFRFSSRPPVVNIYPDGSFQMAVAVTQLQEGIRKFPVVIIEREGYETVTLDLDTLYEKQDPKVVQFAATGTPPEAKFMSVLTLPKKKAALDLAHGQQPQEVTNPKGEK